MLPALQRELPANIVVELLRSGHSVCVNTRGGSMWPAIPSGSRLELQPCLAAELQVGEMAAFERDGQVIVHRVTHVAAEAVRFQGDSRLRSDGNISPSQVLGRVRWVERRPLRWRLPRRTEVRGLWRGLQQFTADRGRRVFHAIRRGK